MPPPNLIQSVTNGITRLPTAPEQSQRIAEIRKEYEPKFAPLQEIQNRISSGKATASEGRDFARKTAPLMREYRMACARC